MADYNKAVRTGHYTVDYYDSKFYVCFAIVILSSLIRTLS